MSIIRTWCELKLWHVQFNVLNRQTLLAAQKNPEKYRNLVVLEFIRPYRNVVGFELLPYHRFGVGKYDILGRVYGLRDFPVPDAASLARLRAVIGEAFALRAAAVAPS
ncbi:MAG: hypothetical protein IT516_17830 [Burkholderiales bacterium]|nr:hypothetical protein [Burkholderiales bacterium]